MKRQKKLSIILFPFIWINNLETIFNLWHSPCVCPRKPESFQTSGCVWRTTDQLTQCYLVHQTRAKQIKLEGSRIAKQNQTKRIAPLKTTQSNNKNKTKTYAKFPTTFQKLACVEENKYHFINTITPCGRQVFIINKPVDTTDILANRKVKKLLSIPPRYLERKEKKKHTTKKPHTQRYHARQLYHGGKVHF